MCNAHDRLRPVWGCTRAHGLDRLGQMPVVRAFAMVVLLVSIQACDTRVDEAPPDLSPGADFYQPPDPLPDGDRGDVIWTESLFAPDGVTAWRILYRSVGYDGQPVAVSGWVAFSDSVEEAPVISFGHGTTGIGDECAPTRRGGQAPHNFLTALDSGFAVAFTDYQGLGTPGMHHYMNGRVEANAMVDIAVAASQLGRQTSDEVGLWGFSQGGHAALFAAEHFDSIAPGRRLIGTAAVAPAVDISGWFAEDPPGQRHYLAMIAVAAVDALGLEPDAVLSDALLDRHDQIEGGCLFDATLAVSGLTSLFADGDPPDALKSFFSENDPGTTGLVAPLLLVNGVDDRLLTPELSDAFADQVCAVGTVLERIVISDASHLDTFGESANQVVDWFTDRLEGRPVDDWCSDVD